MDISIERLLDLPVVQVLNAEITESEFRIHVEFSQHFAICHRCGQKATEFLREGQTLRLQHLPSFGRDVFLHLHTKRYSCLHCDDRPSTTQHGDWYDTDAHCTKAFAEFLLMEMINSTAQDVARKHGVTYDTLRGLLDRYINAKVDWKNIKQLRDLGIDEISRLKGHSDFVTVVSTHDKQGRPVLLAILEGREKATVLAFLKSIPKRLRNQVEQVCTDLYEGFSGAVKKALPNAKVVADRFHVAKLYRGAVDDLRKREMKELKRSLKPEEYDGLKGVMWLLRRKSEDLTTEELAVLELLFDCSPALRKAYQLREKLTAIFDTKHTKESAAIAIRAWIKEVKRSGLDCFDKFLGTLDKWMDEITNYFVSRLTSGWVEGLNNKIKVLKRRCYGLTNITNFFRRLWLDLHGYEAFAH
jgi:transposase